MQQQGRTTLVTGGNRGIGLAVVASLVADGATALMGARDVEAAEAAAADLDGPGEVHVVRLDVTDHGGLRALAGQLGERFGHVDGLVNNAGVDYDTDQRPSTADLERVRRTLDVNTLGPWAATQAMLGLLRAADSPRIVNVSSGAGQLHGMGAGAPAYSTSKAALSAVTRLFAAELRDDGFLVNAVCPGWVRTDMGGSSATRSPAEGAASVRWALDLDDDGPTGAFFRDGDRLDW